MDNMSINWRDNRLERKYLLETGSIVKLYNPLCEVLEYLSELVPLSSETKPINGDPNLVSIEVKKFPARKARARDISKLATTMSTNLSKFYERVALARENEETRDLSTYGICFSGLDVIFLEAKVVHRSEVVVVYKMSRGKIPECVAGIDGFVNLVAKMMSFRDRVKKTIDSMQRLHDIQNKMTLP
ncbi:hypothetical protein BGX21_005737 [Mortierella sp. AD011]|nr:hypothetical protein BGX21_005737 [Mortierella sp. AD011]